MNMKDADRQSRALFAETGTVRRESRSETRREDCRYETVFIIHDRSAQQHFNFNILTEVAATSVGTVPAIVQGLFTAPRRCDLRITQLLPRERHVASTLKVSE